MLAREAGDKLNTAEALTNLGRAGLGTGDFIDARAFYEESLALRREIGGKDGIGRSLNDLGWVANLLGDFAEARAFLEESLDLHREMGYFRNNFV